MSLEKSQKIVKVLGILDIIAAVLCVLGAVAFFGLGGAALDTEEAATNADLQQGVAIFFALGIIMLVSGVADLLEGIFALRTAKDASKVKPLWVLSIIGVVLGVMALVTSIVKGTGNVGSDVISLAISCCMFYLANNIKKLAK